VSLAPDQRVWELYRAAGSRSPVRPDQLPRGWPWSSRCSSPATSAQAPASSNPTWATSPAQTRP